MKIATLALFVVGGGLLAQQPQSSITLTAAAPPPVRLDQISVSATNRNGSDQQCYWVVASYVIGKALPSGPVCINNLQSNSVITIGWGGTGAVSYDVLRYTGSSLPGGTNNIAVGTTNANSLTDTDGGALTAYTVVTSVGPAQATIVLNNKDYAAARLVMDTPMNLYLGAFTATGLPPAAPVYSLAFVTDGVTSSDCSVGGGTALALCGKGSGGWTSVGGGSTYDPTKSGGVYFKGVTSGGTAIVVRDAAGGPYTFYWPTTDGTGLFLQDNGAIACDPGLPTGFPNTCHQGVWTAAGGGLVTRTFNGLNQAGVQGWNLQWDALTNITLSTTDSTHITPLLVVTAAATGSALRSRSSVTSTVTSVTFSASVRSTDGTNPGSIALAYACTVDGGDMDNPSFTSLTALTLATISSTRSTYNSTQAVSCTGTVNAPATLWVKWTPTAPSGGTLSISQLSVTY